MQQTSVYKDVQKLLVGAHIDVTVHRHMTFVTILFGRLRQEDYHKFMTILG